MKKMFVCVMFMLLCASQALATEVNVWGEPAFGGFSLSTINNFYNGLPGHDSSIISGNLNTNNLAGVRLLWAVQPANSYTSAELATMTSFLNNGGRIAFMGEHGGIAPSQNERISDAISDLGGHISINVNYPDSGYHNATRLNGQVLDHSLTTNVNTFNYACFASLSLGVSGPAEKLMLGTDHNQVMMAYENIGPGSIFVITDQNVWDNVYSSWNDNGVMFENLLLGNTGAPPAAPVPEPSTMLFLSGGFACLAFWRRRKCA